MWLSSTVEKWSKVEPTKIRLGTASRTLNCIVTSVYAPSTGSARGRASPMPSTYSLRLLLLSPLAQSERLLTRTLDQDRDKAVKHATPRAPPTRPGGLVHHASQLPTAGESQTVGSEHRKDQRCCWQSTSAEGLLTEAASMSH